MQKKKLQTVRNKKQKKLKMMGYKKRLEMMQYKKVKIDVMQKSFDLIFVSKPRQLIIFWSCCCFFSKNVCLLQKYVCAIQQNTCSHFFTGSRKYLFKL